MMNCSTCKYHNTNCDYEGKDESHCYMFKEWDGDRCMQWWPIARPDTAEENLADNQVRGISM